MKDDTITSLMIAHHALTEALFSIFKDESGKNSKEAKDSLLEFIWEIKKHFFAEEEAVFNILPKENPEISAMIKHLMEEHIIMSDKLKEMSAKLDKIGDREVDEFYEILMHHRELEEKDLYPRLDKELPEQLKREIIGRVNEIPLTPEKAG